MQATTIERQDAAEIRRPTSTLLRRGLVLGSDVAAIALGLAVADLLASWSEPMALTAMGYGAVMLVAMVASSLYSSRQTTVRSLELSGVVRSGIWALLALGLLSTVTGAAIDLRSGLALLVATIAAVSAERELLRRWFRTRREAGQGLWALRARGPPPPRAGSCGRPSTPTAPAPT